MVTKIFKDSEINCSIESIDGKPHFVIRRGSNTKRTKDVIAFGEFKRADKIEKDLLLLCIILQNFSEDGGKIVPPSKYEHTLLFSGEKEHLSSFNSYSNSRHKIRKAIRRSRKADRTLLRNKA